MAWWLIKHMEHVSSIYVTTLPNAVDLFRSVCLVRHKGDHSSRYPSLWTTWLSVDRNINSKKWDHLTWVATVLVVLELNHLLRVLVEKPVAWIFQIHYFMRHTIGILTFCWPCISVYLSQYLTNLMHKICFTISFISCLYMFRAHVLETCRGMK